MENASKALLMAATVLIGVLMMSLGVYLFTIFGDFSADATKKLNQKNIDEFNAQFTKLISYQENGNWQNKCRAQDIVTVANIARETNKKYEYTTSDHKGYYYVRVIVYNKNGRCIYRNFEDDTGSNGESKYTDFLKNYSGNSTGSEGQPYNIKYFICQKDEVVFNEDSKRVCSITFREI